MTGVQTCALPILSHCTLNAEIVIRNSIIAFNSKIIGVKNQDEKIFLLGEGTQVLL